MNLFLRIRLLVATTATLLVLPAAWAASQISELSAPVREELRSSPLLAGGTPATPAFTWTLERQRSGKEARLVTEIFGASSTGMPVIEQRELQSGAPDKIRTRLSLRGLMTLDSGDMTTGLKFEGLVLPVAPGAQFTFVLTRDGRSITKQCSAGPARPASELHANLPGQYVPIECTGRGEYLGMTVRSKGSLAWLQDLGMFLQLSERAEMPLFKFSDTVRITAFELK
jgi:hypothetical protein